MILQRFYDPKLAQASYLVGCSASGTAVVIDPARDVEPYLAAAAAEGLAITAVTETHIHADFVSGSRELAARTGARLYLSALGGAEWQYAYAGEAGAVLLRDGDTIAVGNLRLDAWHTPGHTPEHLAFVLTDRAAADRPMGIFSGDFLFVGDVGRPDLLEKAAGVVGSQEVGARALFRSLQAFKRLPDYLQIWPGHGAGSACGKGLSGVPQSTVGYERLTNWALAYEDEEQFVRAVLEGQPEPPRYFAQMKRINRLGPPVLGGPRRPSRLSAVRLAELVEAGALVVDTRPAGEFAAGHIPATLNLPLDRSFPTWAGWLLPYDTPFYLLVDDRCPHCLDEVLHDLASIGLDGVEGYAGVDAVAGWAAAGRPLATVETIGVAELADLLRRGAVAVIDVRGRSEWEAGHLPGVPNLPLGYLNSHLHKIPRDRPVVVQCQSGARSAIAASLLQAQGLVRVRNLRGGLAAWQAAGYPVERGVGALARTS